MIEYTPWADGGGGVRMGLTPITAEHWLQYPLDYGARLQHRRLLLQNRPQDVFARRPGAQVDAAQQEVAALINAAITATPTAYNQHERADEAFLTAGRSVCEDLCLLLPDGDDYNLQSALLCAPSFWFLRQKLGLALPGIHAPVAQLEQKIGERIRTFLHSLQPDRVFTRGNWHLHNTGELFHPQPDDWTQAHTLTPENIGHRLWLRCERQTLRKLPHSGAVLFTILVYVNPLEELAQQSFLAALLWRAYLNMAPEEREARHFNRFSDPLQQWLTRLPQPARGP